LTVSLRFLVSLLARFWPEQTPVEQMKVLTDVLLPLLLVRIPLALICGNNAEREIPMPSSCARLFASDPASCGSLCRARS
jgi:hypothetical protein